MDNRKIVHIALVGGQTMPVYLAIRESNANHYIFIHSSTTFSPAQKLAEDTQSEKGATVELKEIDPLEYTLIIEELESVISKYNEYIVEANISSGTKPWSIAFSKLSVKYDNIQLIYVDQNSVIYNYKTLIKKIVPAFEGGIKQILRYNQTQVGNYVNLNEYTSEDEKVLKKIKTITKKYWKQFRELTNIDDNEGGKGDNPNNDDNGCRIGSLYGSKMNWKKQCLSEDGSVVQSVSFDIWDFYSSNLKAFKLESPHALDLTLNYHWFEYEVATILSEWHACDEVWMNVEISYKANKPKNEIDIIVSTGRKLLFVECKTKVKNNLDIDKFSSVARNYGKLGAKALFINKFYMGPEAEEKCDDNELIHFSFRDKDNIPVEPKKLYELLDSNMQINNTR